MITGGPRDSGNTQASKRKLSTRAKERGSDAIRRPLGQREHVGIDKTRKRSWTSNKRFWSINAKSRHGFL